MIDRIWFASIQFVQFVVVVDEHDEMMVDLIAGIGIGLALLSKLLMGFGKGRIALQKCTTLLRIEIASHVKIILQNSTILQFNAINEIKNMAESAFPFEKMRIKAGVL